MNLINPIEKSITLADETEKIFVLSKFPAIQGREIVSQYPLSGLPKLGEYKTNQEIMLKMLAFVGVPIEGKSEPLMLTTQALINNHVPDWEALAKIEIAMMVYNCSFFGNGKASTFLDSLTEKVPALILSMLTDLSAQLSQTEKPPSKSSEPSTP